MKFPIMRNFLSKVLILLIILISYPWQKLVLAETVSIGLNYPATGPYRVQGIQQKRAATLAVDEINSAGGILGYQLRLIQWDSQSDAEVTKRNVTYMIEQDGVKMVLGSATSADVLAAGEVCQNNNIPFFATLGYANEITGTHGHRYVFRECYTIGMATKVLSTYLRDKFPVHLHRYFSITTQERWGMDSEAKLRSDLIGQNQEAVYNSITVPFAATYNDLWSAIHTAKAAQPDVLVLILLGDELVTALKLALITNLKAESHIVTPSITQGMAKSAGAQAIEGVISTAHWIWEVPYHYNYSRGKEFVKHFLTRYGNLPGSSAASAYTVIYEYKAAVERAGTFTGSAVVQALEGNEYQLLKDKQMWRSFDHQSIQTVYLVRGHFTKMTIDGSQHQSFFEFINAIPGIDLLPTREEWNAARLAVEKPIELEALPIDTHNEF